MPTIRIDRFEGLAPRFDRRNIPVGAAQVAKNIRFDAGDLKPFQAPKASGLPVLGVTGANIGNILYYRNGDQRELIPFGEAMHVTGTRSPVSNDQYKRFYWNVKGGSGAQGLFAIGFHEDPEYPNPAPLGSGDEYREFQGYRVGVPAPRTAPEVTGTVDVLASVSGESGSDIKILSLSSTNPVQVNLDGEPPFENGQRVRLSINPAYPKPAEQSSEEGPPPEDPEDPPSTDGQIWALDGLEGTVTEAGASSFKITGVSASSFTDFSDADIEALTITRELREGDLINRAYVFTYVTEFDEEGPPSPPSNIVNVSEEAAVNLDVSDAAFDESHGGSRNQVNRIRIYRATVTSGGQTVYNRVGTLPFSGGANEDTGDLSWDVVPLIAPVPAWTGKIVDAVTSVELGDPIESETWFPPPEFDGIAQMENGFLAGWAGNEVWFSEPGLPHAWSQDNIVTLPEDVIGAESVGNTLICGTASRPYAISGVDPSSMVARKLPHHAPLLHPRAIADAGTGVVYASDTGLVWANSQTARNLTPKWTKETWLDAVRDLDRMVFFDGMAILFAPGQQPLCLTLLGDEAEASYLSLDFSCAVRRENSLAIITEQQVSGTPYRVVEYFNESEVDDEPDRMVAQFRSGMLTFHRPVNPGVAQILADGYPVTFTLYSLKPQEYPNPVAGQPDLENFQLHTYEVLGPEPFRLASGYLSREFYLDLEGSSRIQRVVISTDMGELRAQP